MDQFFRGGSGRGHGATYHRDRDRLYRLASYTRWEILKRGLGSADFSTQLLTRLEPRTSSQSGTGHVRGNDIPLNPLKIIIKISGNLVEPRWIGLLTSSLPEWRSGCSENEGKGGEMK